MTINLKSQQDYYDDFQNEVQSLAPELTDFSEGAINDIEAGVISSAARELTNLISAQFANCFIGTANGPEVTGNSDDLQALAVDNYGSAFERPGATAAVASVLFSRATDTAGAVSIDVGTIVKTPPDAAGNSQRFSVITTVSLGPTSLSVSANVQAVVAGSAGEVNPGTITVIESSLTDNTITVNNSQAAAGGEDAEDDADYRQTIYNLIETLKGGTVGGVESLAKTIPGVANAVLVENQQVVIGWDIASSRTIGPYFRIPKSVLYISDSDGSANDALVANVQNALMSLRSCGVRIQVMSGEALTVNWMASIVLNPLGPNFDTLESDTSQIVASMTDYINALPIGTAFVRFIARNAILAIWGSTGTNDLTDFIMIEPTGDVSASASQKLIPGSVGTV